MNRRGSSIVDLFLVIVVLLAFGMASLLAYVVFNDYNDAYQARDNVGADAKTMIQENKDSFVGVIDPMAIFIVVGLTIALVVGASMINTHPAVFVVALVITAIAIFLAAVYSNVYETFAAESVVSAVESEFTVLPAVLNNLPIIVTVMAFLTAVTLYARSRGGDL